ncbi:glycine zipper 2TM domain-containing protein [Sphingomonas sp. PB4P5]|uniref:glycine zipper 2TM domain-containing protein n=1 Tax=Parasphingomonas puruogangriensis TaxID=3096155 RepID=UPI002FCB321B
MFNKAMLALTALAMGSTAIVATPASAQRYDRGYSQYDRGDRGYDNRNYRDDRRYNNDDRRYRNNSRRNRNDRCDAVGGTVIGAIAGGLLGNSVAGRGDRTLGAVLGAGAGALAGRAIDRSDDPRYCRR